MTQYGIDEAEIAEERLEKCFFRYKTRMKENCWFR